MELQQDECVGCVQRSKMYAGAGILLGVAIGVGAFYLIGKYRG